MSSERSAEGEYRFGAVPFFVALHLSGAAVWWISLTPKLAVWFFASYFLRVFGVTAGYHRYFSHRSYRLHRVAQFAMAFLAQTSGQKGVLWWAAHHRLHHRESDRERDVHSPAQRGFWWAHIGWILSNEFDDYDPSAIADFARYPEIRWLDRHHWVPTVFYGAIIAVLGGWPAFAWAYLAATIAVYHCTFAINSLAHLWGTRRFDTPDHSRNNFWLAIVTLGEGWHNNHHHSPGSCHQGARWWELDLTYAMLKALSWIGIARDLRPFRMISAARIPS